MKVFPYFTEDNRLAAFEISNLLCGREKATRIASSIEGVRILRKPKKLLSWFREEVFCEFELEGVRFEILEPFGDNSRFLIGSEQSGAESSLEKVRKAFSNA